mgnify:CR=1 FL=1
MKKFIFNSMLLGGLVMTSCSDNVLEKPVHEAINAMIARMMADHADKLMNSDN